MRLGSQVVNFSEKKIEGTYVSLNNERFYKIENSDAMRPFFMSVVSDSNHWMFIASNGGLTAGRKDAESSLFPYYTDDKITESTAITGPKSIFRITKNGQTYLWEPFSDNYVGIYITQRNLYKNALGNKIIFEEINKDLGVAFQYEWNSSNKFGFVRKSKLSNISKDDLDIALLDGIQNILPYGVNSNIQNTRSNLVDAYKKNELEKDTGLGIYSLSSVIVDKAEPSEALKSTLVWSIGIDNPTILISSLQLSNFRKGFDIQTEEDVRAEKGAFLLQTTITLNAQSNKEWLLVANVNQDASAVAYIKNALQNPAELKKFLLDDVELGSSNLQEIAAAADGFQKSEDELQNTRHYANVLFNIMRGGIFDSNYTIEKNDFLPYLEKANKEVYKNNQELLAGLKAIFTVQELRALAAENGDANFKRLCLEYMPLKFSRRHGDPSRPWNKFSINTRSEMDGSKILDYEGNWRDIFQNWESLAHSYPLFIESMIQKFLNTSTFDGYNPYRVTKGGFDWEVIEPDDPWSFIGYWGDHQIIYLLKFLEFSEDFFPGALNEYFNKDVFVYANVPYKIKSYQDLLKDPKDTIDFDHEAHDQIEARREILGADGALLENQDAKIHKVNLIEKLLATVLAKCSNFIPEAGIWMNTQRPEWNDANNALVGNGVSMVTLCYLRRFFTQFQTLIENSDLNEFELSQEMKAFFDGVTVGFETLQYKIDKEITDADRKDVLDVFGNAGSDYRTKIYSDKFSGEKATISKDALLEFIHIGIECFDHTIQANKRTDNLYHSYNLMSVDNDDVNVDYLAEMLEGQVAVLSAGTLKSDEVLELLTALRNSNLYRENQHSYLLYPDRNLARFVDRNNISKVQFESSQLLQQLVADNNQQIILQDIDGAYHFNGNFNNANDLTPAFEALPEQYQKLVQQDSEQIHKIFEEIFNHKAFTGRSGTFYGYEGLGSIYWHMVSKLVLAVQENCQTALKNKESKETVDALVEHFHDLNEGIGVHKSPEVYGAIPTDPYSHTPGGKGAQQPGMTGQVKEDILSRFGELGLFVKDGSIVFNPKILKIEEFLQEDTTFTYWDIHSNKITIDLPKNSLAFTYCQVPIIYRLADENNISVKTKDHGVIEPGHGHLSNIVSSKIFNRTDEIESITVSFKH